MRALEALDSKRTGCFDLGFDKYGKIGILIKPFRQNGRNFEGHHARGNGKAKQAKNLRLDHI
jgi:hypothetical protein